MGGRSACPRKLVPRSQSVPDTNRKLFHALLVLLPMHTLEAIFIFLLFPAGPPCLKKLARRGLPNLQNLFFSILQASKALLLVWTLLICFCHPPSLMKITIAFALKRPMSRRVAQQVLDTGIIQPSTLPRQSQSIGLQLVLEVSIGHRPALN